VRWKMVLSWMRLLLVQASWNYERMVGVGVAFASEPMLRGLPGGKKGERYRQAVGRAAQYFNAHPYLTGLAVGALARAEYENVPPEKMHRLRTALTGPLGSLGDKLVWVGVLPMAAGVGLLISVAVSPVVGVVSFLVLYNGVHLALRCWGLWAGWHGGIRVAEKLSAPVFKLGLRVVGPLAALSLGLALPTVIAWLARDYDWGGSVGVGIVALVGVAFARWIWPTLGGMRFGLLVVALAAAAGWV